MRTVAIIQARMGSSRLPGKVLMPLAGKPVLWHIVHRLRKCHTLDAIAIATSTGAADDPIQDFGSREGVPVVRGPEDNVLLRYAMAAEQLQADIIVRVTGDAPLVDCWLVDRLVQALVQNTAGFVTARRGVPCIHEGIDPFTREALRKLCSEASEDPVAREHVTSYFKEHPDFVRIQYVDIPLDYQVSGVRISLDTPADLRFLEEVYARLGAPAGDAEVSDVVRLLRSQPDLQRINAHVRRKSLNGRSRGVLIRCDGDAELGLGHVYRCLALADELRATQTCGVSFAMIRGPVGIDLARESGFPVQFKPADLAEDLWLRTIVRELQPDAVVFDVRTALSRETVEGIRQTGPLTIVIDDGSDRRLSADLALYPPVPQAQRLDWIGFTGELHIGWEWIILRPEFARHRPPALNSPHTALRSPRILVTMGGSDPAGLTLKALAALDRLEDDFTTTVVLGPAFMHEDALANWLASGRRHYDILRDVTDMAEVMAQADMAIASFGVTAYELGAMGVPAIYLCLSHDHAESASALVEAGVAISLGVHDQVDERTLADQAAALLRGEGPRSRFAMRAAHLVDGHGATRVATLIGERITAPMTASKHWNGHSGPVLDSVNGFDVIECAVCDFNHVVPTGSAEDAIQQGVLTNAIHKCSTRPDVKASPSNFA